MDGATESLAVLLASGRLFQCKPGGGGFGGWFVCAQSITIVVEPWLLRACMLVVSERARKSEGEK
jgi:hypothetical protein